ncbi:GNAT family N-acetyltransferase [Lachnospiraceae bacterium ZAX-1]
MRTQRLIIRRFKTEDWAQIYEYLSDGEVVKYEPRSPLTEEECRQCIAQFMASDDFWAVCLKKGRKLIGQICLSQKEQNHWELGYIFNRKFQKKGYATEAIKKLLDDAFRKRKVHQISACCNPQNTASWKLLERIGMRKKAYFKENTYFKSDRKGNPIWQDTFIYGILEEEWKYVK